MNRLTQLFENKQRNILNIYFTAGYPNLDDLVTIGLALDQSGVDIIEIGMPYSDPLADGPTIQASSQQALKNGMSVSLLFEQITHLRKQSNIPIILMGNFNQVMQYGENQFFRDCKAAGVDGIILPDMPAYVYEEQFQELFEELDLGMTFLVAPQTEIDRLRKINNLNRGFIYVVSSAAITGGTGGISVEQEAYFDRITNFDWQHSTLIGFGIKDAETFEKACSYANGAIIGSAFIRALADSQKSLTETVTEFVNGIRNRK